MKRMHALATALAIAALAGSALVAAAVTDIATTPLASSASNIVKPNVSFVLDTSGSMAWSHAPDESEPFFNKVGYKASQCNTIYYDPNIIYPPPRNADGTQFPNASFSGAWKDGFDTSAGTVNLGSAFYAYDNTSSSGNGTDTAQAAYYYKYVGSEIGNGANYLNQNSNFYKECSLPASNFPTATITVGSGSNSTSVTSITVNGTNILNGATTASTTGSTVASRIAANVTLNGFTATVSGSVVTITAPNNTYAGTAVVVNRTGTRTITATNMSPFVRVQVSSSSGPLATDERQNFANWFSYYRIRIMMMKSGAGRAFSGIGTGYRVGFMTIYATPSNSTTDPSYLKINDFDVTQKSSFFSKMYATDPSGNTPLKTALTTASRNLAGKVGPDPLQYSCQQQFVILTTDGYWNAGTANGKQLNGTSDIGNQDNSLALWPRPMYDGGLSGSTNTLADVAAYYYKTDLRDSSLGACNTGVSGADVCTNNVPVSGLDNAAHQHVTLFTLGLGVQGSINYATDYLSGGSADFNAITSGSKDWPTPTGDTLTTIDDLWHAAVNGHGQYFSAKNPDLLVSGLQSALAGISAREAAGAAAATSNLEPVAGDNFAYVANYRTQKWDGDLEARTIDLVSGAISNTPVWSAQPLLDARVSASSDSRNIFTYLSGAKVPFLPASFTAAQKSSWFTPANAPVLSQYAGYTALQIANATADNIINYLRGQSGNERLGSNPAANQLFRVREHVLGDIVNGKPVYVKAPPFLYTENNYQTFKTTVSSRPGAVYVAANDGMLHSFDSATGEENWAYVPSFALPNMKALADDTYPNNHRYLVDGSPTVSDVWTGTAWRTILVAGLNAGGKGYYALDVTDPLTPSVLWEFTDANMGYSYGNPIVGKLADGTWVVVFTSGYNNPDGVGRLYVLNAYSGTTRFIMSTGAGTATTPSGLSKISAWVDNGLLDNTLQRVYGGDNLGNLWRFDINDQYPPTGRDAFKLAFFQSGAYQQPVTTKPELGLIGSKPIIFVGTGRYLGASDLVDVNQQSLYAIRDDLSATPIGNARSGTCAPSGTMVQQTLTVIDTNTRSTSTNTVDFAVNCGWFLDFNPANSTPGERVNVDPKLQLGVLAVATNIPENSVCTVGGSSFLYFFDYGSGRFITNVPGGVVGQRISSSIAVGLNTYRLPDGRVVTTVTTSDDKHPVFGNPSNPLIAATGKRVLWRELLQ